MKQQLVDGCLRAFGLLQQRGRMSPALLPAVQSFLRSVDSSSAEAGSSSVAGSGFKAGGSAEADGGEVGRGVPASSSEGAEGVSVGEAGGSEAGGSDAGAGGRAARGAAMAVGELSGERSAGAGEAAAGGEPTGQPSSKEGEQAEEAGKGLSDLEDDLPPPAPSEPLPPAWEWLGGLGGLPLTALVPLHALCCLALGEAFYDVADLGGKARVGTVEARLLWLVRESSEGVGAASSCRLLLQAQVGQADDVAWGTQGMPRVGRDEALCRGACPWSWHPCRRCWRRRSRCCAWPTASCS